jgi:hypothetical protein
MPSSRALWQICRRLRAAPLDKEEPRTHLLETVWKIGISPTLGSYQWSRRGQQCHFASSSATSTDA